MLPPGLPRPPSPRLAARPALELRPPLFASHWSGESSAAGATTRTSASSSPEWRATSARIVSSSTGAVATTSSLRLMSLAYQASPDGKPFPRTKV